MTVKKSLFIQTQWYDPKKLKAALEHIRLYHRDPAEDDYIHNIVLDEIGGEYGLSPNLNIIAPYLPGGSLWSFDNVFVGSHYIPWAGPGHSYNKGILDGGHRWKNLVLQKSLWQQFRAKYRHIPFHFYINHEGVLDYFDDKALANSYEAYLIQSARDAHDVSPGAALMWAPAIWAKRGLNWRERSAIARVFKNVRAYSRTGGVTWLHLQDMQGRKYKPSLYNVRTWYKQLKRMGLFASLRIDMELFKTNADGSLQADTPAAVAKREAYYRKYGVPVGASWELRWWMENHQEK